MKITKIIIPVSSFISILPPVLLAADDNNFSSNSFYGSEILESDSNYPIGFIGRYDAGLDRKNREQITSYDLFSGDDNTTGNAWVGVVGGESQLRVGRHDSVDNMATAEADQNKAAGAYGLLMRGDEMLSNSLTYIKKTGSFAIGAQYAEGNSSGDKKSVGLLLNTRAGEYEAAIGYRRNPENNSSIKGRVTYKSRNNSKIRVDVVAEKIAVGGATDGTGSDSISYMVGAKYDVTPKAYVVGQYGAVGFNKESSSEVGASLSRDYNALSVEAGYRLSGSTSIYVNHTQKIYNSSSFLTPFVDNEEGTQTNSIGVRLNW